MHRIATAAVFAFGTLAMASPAAAWNVHNPYGHDTRCDKVNCYTPGTAYMHGHYSHLTCKDKHKYLTYRDGKLMCVPHKYVAK